MPQNGPAEPVTEQQSAEFMLEEFRQSLNSFWKTEELGEKRVEFFITLTSAVFGGLLLLDRIASGASLAALAVLFLIGQLLLLRILRRNVLSHEYLRAAGRVRMYFAERSPGLSEYMFSTPGDSRPVRGPKPGPAAARAKRAWVTALTPKTGGLAELVSLVNSLLVGAFAGLAIWCLLEWGAPRASHVAMYVCSLAVGTYFFCAAWYLEGMLAETYYAKNGPRPKDIRRPCQEK
jgi:hypothetical protein